MPSHRVQNVDAYQPAELARNFVKVGRRSPSPRAKTTSCLSAVERGKAVIVTVSARKGIGNEFYE